MGKTRTTHYTWRLKKGNGEELDIERPKAFDHRNLSIYYSIWLWKAKAASRQAFEEAQAQTPSKATRAIRRLDSTQQNSGSMGFHNPQGATKYNWPKSDRLQEWIPSFIKRTCVFFFTSKLKRLHNSTEGTQLCRITSFCCKRQSDFEHTQESNILTFLQLEGISENSKAIFLP